MISVIVPVYNEEANIRLFYKELSSVLNKIKEDYEIIFVDDGSTDRSFSLIKEINKNDKRVKAIKFRRNFGQTAAINTGIRHANGDKIITMDADLQNDPNEIPMLIKKLNEGYYLVNGWRYKRRDPLFTKKIPSKFSNWLVRKLTKVNLHDQGCTLRIMRKEAVKNLRLYGEMHRFIPAIVAMNGFKVAEIKVKHRERRFGKTKYKFNRLLKGFLDLLYIKFWYTYSTRPLHFFGALGFLQYFLAILIFIEQIIKALAVKQLNLGPLLMLGILLVVTGTLFIVFGFLGEILIRTYYSKEEDISIEKILD
ncbi:MAG: glycosyltransferase family 2 protein [Nanoarchaeota archaeon]